MNKQEIQNKIKEVEEELAKLRRNLEKELEKGIWIPDEYECEEYYYIYDDGDIMGTCNEGCTDDTDRFAIGNYYKTEEEAEYQLKVQKYTNLFRKYVEEHSDKLDWNNRHCPKYLISYDTDDKRIYYPSAYYSKNQGAIYASSENILKDAIEFVGEDNVIKYVLGVK